MRFISLLVALNILPGLGIAQDPPGKNINVDVRVAFLEMRDDTSRVEYFVFNLEESVESLFHFTVDAPSRALFISQPEPTEDWTVATDYRGRGVAEWAVLGEQMAPGDSSPLLAFEATGLPGVVNYWVRGYIAPPPLTDTLPVSDPTDPLIENSVVGETVGIEPFPDDLTPTSLVDRLRGLTDRSCNELGWIADAAACTNLDDRLFQVIGLLSEAQNTKAKIQLQTYVDELDDQHSLSVGSPVNDNAFWMLTVNAEFLLGLIPDPVTVTASPAADTYLRQGAPNQNEGDALFLRLRANGNNRGLVQVTDADLAAAVGGGTVVNASLELTITRNANNWTTAGRTVDIHRVTVAWTEEGATWRCAVDTIPTNASTDCDATAWEMGMPNQPEVHPFVATPTSTLVIANGQSGVVTFDVTADVQAFVAGSASNSGWVIKKTLEGQSGLVEFGSRESSTAPRLVLEVIPK